MAYYCQEILDSIWLSYYPRPKEISMDNGSKFKKEFSDLYKNMGLKKKVSNKRNPKLNAILQRIHQVLGNRLQVFDLKKKEINPIKNDPFDKYLNTVA